MHISSENAFLEVITHFENNPDEQVTVYDLINKMADLCDEPYGFTYIKKKILDHFGGTVIITELDGKHNVVTFKDKADAILHSFYQRNNKQDTESEKSAVIKTAANLIMSDIKSISCTKEEYPNPEKLKSINTNSDFLFLDSTFHIRRVVNVICTVISMITEKYKYICIFTNHYHCGTSCFIYCSQSYQDVCIIGCMGNCTTFIFQMRT